MEQVHLSWGLQRESSSRRFLAAVQSGGGAEEGAGLKDELKPPPSPTLPPVVCPGQFVRFSGRCSWKDQSLTHHLSYVLSLVQQHLKEMLFINF